MKCTRVLLMSWDGIGRWEGMAGVVGVADGVVAVWLIKAFMFMLATEVWCSRSVLLLLCI